MIDTKALREKILDIAIRGKLVPQDPNDEPASVLLERIRAQKQQMVKEGKLKAKDIKNDTIIFKGEDNLHYEQFRDGTVKCIEDEIPFEIPESWEWCRLSMVGTTNIGLTYKPTEVKESGTIVFRSCNIKNGKINFTDLVRVQADIRENQYIYENDILMCARNGSRSLVGKCAIIQNLTEVASFGAFMAVFRSICNQYIYYYFNTYLFRSTFDNDDSKQINQVTQAILRDALIPLPPFAEQTRIVTKLHEILSLVDFVNDGTNQIETMIANAKSKILDLAIRGKLVPQDPNDELASVLLERIKAEKEELIKQGKIKRDKKESVIFKGEDNSYYEKYGEKLPAGWVVTNFENLLEYEQPTKYIVRSTNYKSSYKTPVLTAGKSFILGYTNEANNIFNDLPVIIFDDFTTESKFVDFPFKVKSSAMKILHINTDLILPKYAFYLMQTTEIDHENHQRYWISTYSQEDVALPPLNEQKRILARLEYYFTLLDQIQ